MKNILIILKKELKDTLRDRKTIIMMVLVPLLLVPMLILGINLVMSSQSDKAETKIITIGISGGEFAPELYHKLLTNDKIKIDDSIKSDSLAFYVKNETIDGALIIENDFQQKINADDQSVIQLLYKGTDAFEAVYNRISTIIEEVDSTIVAERLVRLNLDKNLFDAIAIDKVDLSSIQEIIGKIGGGFLPYIFIIFGFMGAMYPGIDLGAGEKERGTLETLLSTPADRYEIVVGKFLMVMLASIMTATIAMLGVYIGVQSYPEIPEEYLSIISEMFSIKMLLMILSLVIPISAFFAGLILSLSIYAKSFKEAQSMISPFNIIIIFPALLGTLPGIELNFTTALIPILNVSLATKDVLAGTIDPLLLAEVYVSLFIYASISLLFCVKWFKREETLFRI